MGLQKEFHTLQTGQADEGYSRRFVWLNQSQCLNTCSFLFFFGIVGFWYPLGLCTLVTVKKDLIHLMEGHRHKINYGYSIVSG